MKKIKNNSEKIILKSHSLNKIWEFTTEKELEEWEIIKNEGSVECISWLYKNGYLNIDIIIKEFNVYYNDRSTALECLREKYIKQNKL